MSIFSRKAELEPEPQAGGGLSVIRAHVRSYVRHCEAHAIFSRETAIGSEDVHAFIGGKDNLTATQIAAALKHLSINATYDEIRDVLVSRAREIAPMCSADFASQPPLPVNSVAPATEPMILPNGAKIYPPPLYSRPEGAPAPEPRKAAAGWA